MNRSLSIGRIEQIRDLAQVKKVEGILLQEWEIVQLCELALERLDVYSVESAPPEAAPKLTEIVHVAVSRALDEAGIKNEVLRGMCIEVALETLPQPQNSTLKGDDA